MARIEATRRFTTPASLRIGELDNRRLRYGLLWLAAGGAVPGLVDLVLHFPIGIDARAPLLAAERWSGGQTPYLASSFGPHPGLDVPFLYPPYVLPYLVPLLALARPLAIAAALLAGLVAAIVACRRLGVPGRALPLVLCWPPFAEGLWVANVQLLAFAAFVVVFWVARPAVPWRPRRRPLEPGAPLRVGLAAAGVAVVKISQVHAWVVLLRRAPRAALAGAVTAAVLVLASLPFTGPALYGDWLAQLQRASDPAWALIGSPLLLFLPGPFAWTLSIASVLIMLAIPRRDAGAWAGIAALVGAPNIHTYTWLFLLPAMLVVRREVALLAALAVASYQPPIQWLGLLAVSVCLGLSGRWPALREPELGSGPGGRPLEASAAAAARVG